MLEHDPIYEAAPACSAKIGQTPSFIQNAEATGEFVE